MILILLIVVGLVAWALHLMQQAIQFREFSLMLAGFLVSAAAAAMMSVYFLTGHLVGYMSSMPPHSYAYDSVYDVTSLNDLSEIWNEDWIETVSVDPGLPQS
jgi:hypothetical protein